MNLADLAKGIDGQVNSVPNTCDTDITGITSDSRNVESGYLFAAIPGTVTDGLAFVPQAIKRGASAILMPDDASPVPDTGELPVITSDNIRRQYAVLAGRLHGRQPGTIVAITGTNGKTSVAAFLRQIWNDLGLKAGSAGTLGSGAGGAGLDLSYPGALTTPDPAELHRIVADMVDHGVEHLAIEASSHGLDQYRLDGLNVSLAAFTNLSRDHLDYHGDKQTYFLAKKRLFTELLRADGTAVINADAPEFDSLKEVLEQRGISFLSFGRAATDIRLVTQKPVGDGQHLELIVNGDPYQIVLPLIGEFQASNVMCALGLAMASGCGVSGCIGALSNLRGVRGRLEHAGNLANGARVYVDYAHTPDALVTVLRAIRPHTSGRLHVIFGCGGDRDPGKRKLMAEAAASNADQVIVTDDNPRGENPATIRKHAMAGCPGALEIGDRRQAIETAIDHLSAGDLLIVAGKGHEQGQIVGDEVRPFDDVSVVKEILGRVATMNLHPIIWSSEEAAKATGGTVNGTWAASGVSINTRTLESGDLFFALAGPNFDGHDFAPDALEHEAAAVVVSHTPDDKDAPCLIVGNTLNALENLARAARDRMNGKIIAVTGSVGKTSTKEMLRLALSDQGEVCASHGNLNNHWGLPLSLSRMSATSDFGLFELGMNSPGEIRPLSRLTRPHVAIITAIEPVHAEFFTSVDDIADAKAEIFEGVVDGGYAVINQDCPHFGRLGTAAVENGIMNVHGFGYHKNAWARLVNVTLHEGFSTVVVAVDGSTYGYRIGAPGEHLVMNSVAVLAAVSLVGADVSAAAERFAEYRAPVGRGNNSMIKTPTGEFVVIDESYNASPASMRAALEVLGRIHPSDGGRRIAVIGDMLELGDATRDEHVALLESLRSAQVDMVFTCGRHTQDLWDVLPGNMRGGRSVSPDKLSMVVGGAVKSGDVVVVKGSRGSKVGVVVDALLALNSDRQTAPCHSGGEF